MAARSVSIDEFVQIIEQSKRDVLREVEKFLVLFIQECVEEIVVGGEYGPGTPVDTGFLRAMWWISINGAGQSTNLVKPGPGERQVSAPLPTLASLSVGDLVELCNNTEYAPYVEYGTSMMAPRAMVGTVVNAANAIAVRCARQLGWGPDSLVHL